MKKKYLILIMAILCSCESDDFWIQYCTDCQCDVKVQSFERAREYHISGLNSKGRKITCDVPDVWFREIIFSVGDRIIKKKGNRELELIKKDTTLYLPMSIRDSLYYNDRTVYSDLYLYE
jgi:hypothetical protein